MGASSNFDNNNLIQIQISFDLLKKSCMNGSKAKDESV